MLKRSTRKDAFNNGNDECLKAIWALTISFAVSTLHPYQFRFSAHLNTPSHFCPRIHNPPGTSIALDLVVCVCVCVWQIPCWLQAGIPLVPMHSRWLLRGPGAQVHALPADTNKCVQDEPGGAHRASRQQSITRAGVQWLIISQHVQDDVWDIQLLL